MKKIDNEMKLEFISKSNNVALARIAIASFVVTLDPTIEEISDIKTAVSEAVTNSIIHGYENEKGTVTVKAEITGKEVMIEVTDNGAGIADVEKAKQPLFTTKPELERSGMGFTIMESFMDEMKVYSSLGKGTKIIMKKTIKN